MKELKELLAHRADGRFGKRDDMKIGELESDIVESEKWIQRVEAENSQLRELNAELLAALKDVRTYVCYSAPTHAVHVLDELIAKAEKLK